MHANNGKPNGSELSSWKYDATDATLLEFHGPCMHGSSDEFMAVKSHLERCNNNSKTLVILSDNDNSNASNASNAESSHPNEFASEFGTSTMSPFESMMLTIIDRSTWGARSGKPTSFRIDYDFYGHNNIISQRNYSCDNHMIAHVL